MEERMDEWRMNAWMNKWLVNASIWENEEWMKEWKEGWKEGWMNEGRMNEEWMGEC